MQKSSQVYSAFLLRFPIHFGRNSFHFERQPSCINWFPSTHAIWEELQGIPEIFERRGKRIKVRRSAGKCFCEVNTEYRVEVKFNENRFIYVRVMVWPIFSLNGMSFPNAVIIIVGFLFVGGECGGGSRNSMPEHEQRRQKRQLIHYMKNSSEK